MRPFTLRSFISADIPAALELWSATPGLGIGLSDTPSEIVSFLQRNPGLSRVAVAESSIIGAVLCGHDGRRGFLYHLAVAQASQRQGVGRALVGSCVAHLERYGIPRTTIHIYPDNTAGIKFWQSIGWHFRGNLAVMQFQPRLAVSP